MTIINSIRIHDMCEYHKNEIDGTHKCYLYRGYDPNTHSFKWMFKGLYIPMPVRSGTWFDGFDPVTMNRWMYDQGWYLHTRVIMP